jgi:hypothetical protein
MSEQRRFDLRKHLKDALAVKRRAYEPGAWSLWLNVGPERLCLHTAPDAEGADDFRVILIEMLVNLLEPT